MNLLKIQNLIDQIKYLSPQEREAVNAGLAKNHAALGVYPIHDPAPVNIATRRANSSPITHNDEEDIGDAPAPNQRSYGDFDRIREPFQGGMPPQRLREVFRQDGNIPALGSGGGGVGTQANIHPLVSEAIQRQARERDQRVLDHAREIFTTEPVPSGFDPIP